MASNLRGSWTPAYIGIGSNLQDPVAQVATAFSDLARLPDSRLTARSVLYLTAPVGLEHQPDFVNAAARVLTRLSAEELLNSLQAIEQRRGRVRGGARWGPRVLDLDILLFGDAVIDRPGLRVPHPELANRAFALVPLAEVAPKDLQVPGQGLLAQLLDACKRDGVEAIGGAGSCGGAPSLAEF